MKISRVLSSIFALLLCFHVVSTHAMSETTKVFLPTPLENLPPPHYEPVRKVIAPNVKPPVLILKKIIRPSQAQEAKIWDKCVDLEHQSQSPIYYAAGTLFKTNEVSSPTECNNEDCRKQIAENSLLILTFKIDGMEYPLGVGASSKFKEILSVGKRYGFCASYNSELYQQGTLYYQLETIKEIK